jgi:hypothetical protein
MFQLYKNLRSQIDNLKKKLDLDNESYTKMKKTYEEQLNAQHMKEKVRFFSQYFCSVYFYFLYLKYVYLYVLVVF